ncbi:MAG: peptide deformylase [Candidatus Scalinduaceae bacterium]
MARLLQIAQLGHLILRKKAEKVVDIRDPLVNSLINDMLATVVDVNGVGLAAPQVYESLRVFVVASHPNLRYPMAPEMESTAMINSEIIWSSDEIVKDWEGCLSIPGIRGLVPRPKAIKVKYSKRNGNSEEVEFSDFIARVFQHEYDHLEGIVFLDRLESTRDIITEKEYQKLFS